ncbi:MAG TPA: DUF4012 domain-containing protein, partial [Ktedonobacterales bacterium]
VTHLLDAKDLFVKSTSTDTSCSVTATPSASPQGSPTPSATATPTTTTTLPGGLSTGSLDLKSLMDKNKLNQAYQDFISAESDFVQLDNELNSHPTLLGLAKMLPSYAKQATEAKQIAQAGIEMSSLAAEVTTTALTVLQALPADPLSAGATPLITSDEVPLIQKTLNDADLILGNLQQQLTRVNPNDLPISVCQRRTFGKLLDLLPEGHKLLDEANTLLPVGIWALGIDQPRNFLVQTMDRAELRPGGGFTGDYGVVTITGGRIGSLALQDIAWLDYCGAGTCYAIGNRAPSQWSWWPFGNFGLRDSNLSADFPTNAQEAINLFAKEGGGNVDGVIDLTPIPIEHILAITGPIYIPDYNETITSDNLEDRLHYYQQDPAGIAKEKQISGSDTSITARKRFTSLVGKLLEDKVRHEPVSQLIQIAKQVLADLQSKDLEIYLSDPQAEQLLTKYQLDGSIDSSGATDTFLVVQANASVSKATQYVQTTEKDEVQLDASGGATHHLTISLDYNKQGNVYGYPTYRDYLRVYAPQGSQYISGYGFDTGSPMCLPSLPPGWKAPTPPTNPTPSKYATMPDCSYYDPYPGGGLACPAGGWATGMPYSFSYVDKTDGVTPWPIDYLGGSRNSSSDIAGLSMWGGWVTVPPNCTAVITLSWYTPKEAAPGRSVEAGQSPYQLLVQRQSGTFNTVDVTITPASDAAAAQGKQQVTYQGTLSTNTPISLHAVNCDNAQACG